MANFSHYRRLENMYGAAPINKFFSPKLHVSEGRSEIEIEISESLFHAAGAVHGSVYFKMLDDAAFFAANSYETEFFVLTTAFTTYLTRPVTNGTLRSSGKVANKNNTQFITESVLFDSNGIEIGRGSGIFVRSKTKLADAMGYSP